MLEVEGEIKKWGNSIGLRMRKNLLKEHRLRLNEKVKAIIIPETGLRVENLLGKLKTRKSTAKIMREIDRDLDIEF